MKYATSSPFRQLMGVLVLGALLGGCIPTPPEIAAQEPSNTNTAAIPTQTTYIRSNYLSTVEPRSYAPIGGTDGYHAWISWPSDIPIAEIPFESMWQSGYRIFSIAYGDGTWVTTFVNPNPPSLVNKPDWFKNRDIYKKQDVLIDTLLPGKEIARARESGFFVTSLAYGDGQWVLVTSKTDEIIAQDVVSYTDFPMDDIYHKNEEDFWVTNLAYGDGGWVVVYSKTNRITGQEVITSPLFPSEQIDKAKLKGRFLTSQSCNEDLWVVIVSNMAIEKQKISDLTFFTKDLIIQFWDAGYDVIKVFYGDGTWFSVAQKEITSPQ